MDRCGFIGSECFWRCRNWVVDVWVVVEKRCGLDERSGMEGECNRSKTRRCG